MGGMPQDPRGRNRCRAHTILFSQPIDLLIEIRIFLTSEKASFPCRRLKRRPRLYCDIVEPTVVQHASVTVHRAFCLHVYYDKKMAEDRTRYNALGHCAGKLVRVIWKMLTDEVEFNLD